MGCPRGAHGHPPCDSSPHPPKHLSAAAWPPEHNCLGCLGSYYYDSAGAGAVDAAPGSVRTISPVLHFEKEFTVSEKQGEQVHRSPVYSDFTITLQFRTKASLEGSGSAIQWHGGHGLVDNEQNGVRDDFGVSFKHGAVLFGIGNPDTTITSRMGFDDGEWHTVVASRRAMTGEFSLWVDGESQGSKVGNTHYLMDNPDLLFGAVGKRDRNRFVGRMRNISIYDTDLTPEQLEGREPEGGTVTIVEKSTGFVSAPDYVHALGTDADRILVYFLPGALKSLTVVLNFLFDLDLDLWADGRILLNFLFDIDVADQ
ncbi:unnamed protein product [Prorocentrum cordatum]|uniref:Laminin G domain-containing protein n=1 Tax=Prorocentrum cordatum TaxID=2364126 RepID=A0ABN9XMV4_9DINO|nr:unnamed protein product [Polarella glacialis]